MEYVFESISYQQEAILFWFWKQNDFKRLQEVHGILYDHEYSVQLFDAFMIFYCSNVQIWEQVDLKGVHY